MAITALQSNAQPLGGTTATQPVPTAMTPTDIQALVEQLAPKVALFREKSSPLSVFLDAQTLNLGDSKGIRIASVGLGYRIISEHVVAISLVNTAGGPQVINVSNLFPFNLLKNTQVQINGGAVVYSASGIAAFAVMTRNRAATWLPNVFSGLGPALSPALVRITVGANGTPTNTAAGVPSFSGLASISVAAGTTCVVTATFYTIEKLALDRESLLGALPLQNNSTFATLTRTMVNSAVGAGPNNHFVPMFTAGAVPGTLTHSLVNTCNSTYEFMSVPDDPTLYQDMVQNSYQVQEQTSLTVSATGASALTYNIPQNQYLVAAHLWAFDSQGNPLPAGAGGLPILRLAYNAGAIVPVNQAGGRTRAAQFIDYADDRQFVGGYRFWDGEDTTEDITDADQMGWIDTYAAATPQLVADVAAGLLTPLTYSVTRESVVAGAVQVVGG